MDLALVTDLRLHAMDDNALDRAVRRFNREREARIAAEELLELKARELFKSNEKLHDLLENLDDKVRQRTEELRIALSEAQVANRVKTDFLAMISHEIRTPMNAVHGVAQILENESLADNQKQLVGLILDASTSLLTIVNDLLDLSKIEAGKMKLETVNFIVTQLAHDIRDLFAVKAKKKHLDLIIDMKAVTGIVVAGDPGRLRQILINLIDNALKYTISGSVTLSVTAESVDTETKSFYFTVTDTGPGISEDKIHRLFNRFDRIDIKSSNNIEGAGLGLALCKQLSELMNGKIGCNSEVGKGTTFWTSVPLQVIKSADEMVSVPAPAPAPATAPELRIPEVAAPMLADPIQADPVSDKKLRILVAEDNIANQIIIKVMLEKLGHLVDIAADGNEAISAVNMLHYDVVLMDMQMPNLDGVEATKRIRAATEDFRNVPIFALTANAMDADKVRCIDAGMNGFLSKPVSRKDLVDTLLKLNVG